MDADMDGYAVNTARRLWSKLSTIIVTVKYGYFLNQSSATGLAGADVGAGYFTWNIFMGVEENAWKQ